MDKNSCDTVVAFYTDFAKAFDRVPHYELLKEMSAIGVGGCFPDILCEYLERRTQLVRVGNTISQQLEITSGVPKGSLVGPLLFCEFKNDLPEVLKFSDPYIFASDLKILAVAKTQEQIKSDLEDISNWVDTNGTSLAPDNCYKLEFRGTNCQNKVGNISFEDAEEVKDQGIFVKNGLNWSAHASRRLKKAFNVLFSLRRNIAYIVKPNTKLSLYKSLVLPIVTYGRFCAKQSKATMDALERLQKGRL